MKISQASTDQTTECRVCKSTKNHKGYDVESAPQILGCAQEGRADQFISFGIWRCENCGFISTDADPEDMAYELLHSEALGPTWTRHKETLAKFCADSLPKGKEAQALEVGPSCNPLLYTIAHEGGIKATFIDMMQEAPFTVKDGDQYIEGAFPLELETKYDIIVASHVLEHVLDMQTFLSGAKNLLSENGSIIISVPNFEIWIGRKYWNAITPEHINYPFKSHFETLANQIGMEVTFTYFEEHSLISKFTKNRAQLASESKSEDFLTPWVSAITTSIQKAENDLKESLSEKAADCVAIAGASHIAQYPCLMSEKLAQNVTSVIDNSKIKHGKRLYGTNLTVSSFESLGEYQSPIAILFNSPYREEMKKQINTINPNARIIEV
ncbi:MAG: methyltransferase domain-containing protein [Alphaproteobacteria bacterium]|nr:methyltransferase domain-containing protein [Alphaproteobacteria bacterium]